MPLLASAPRAILDTPRKADFERSALALVDDPGDDSDNLWRDTTGNTAIWFMNGALVLQAVSLGIVPLTWTIQATNAE
jgi:Flp pilus assembly protein TadG